MVGGLPPGFHARGISALSGRNRAVDVLVSPAGCGAGVRSPAAIRVLRAALMDVEASRSVFGISGIDTRHGVALVGPCHQRRRARSGDVVVVAEELQIGAEKLIVL